ncbi:hypothetical protein [Corallococcus carmarthensis]|uniref:B box-type domain-containing protein n=1 Tax=Corallococcus carmarthensis TaxID=2316728 RepID=A0A3A8JBT3_9BACT|nr:hypothetical protein [Corallococcus carmarthensis]NOK23692.1 hypothetical protein [Corallococcus carmarthensis]RKG93172.1 hypothetical protein D7X32_43880 [Corallococcus carmarthensis]
MSGSAASLAGARCGQHPDVAAVAVCARCGGFLCGECTEVLEETAYCAPCAVRRRRDTRPSRPVRLALLANVGGFLFLGAPVVLRSWAVPIKMEVLLELVFTLVAAVAGTFISTRKLRRRDDVGDRGFATVLRVLAALNLLGLLFWGALTALVLATWGPGP